MVYVLVFHWLIKGVNDKFVVCSKIQHFICVLSLLIGVVHAGD